MRGRFGVAFFLATMSAAISAIGTDTACSRVPSFAGSVSCVIGATPGIGGLTSVSLISFIMSAFVSMEESDLTPRT